MPRNQDDRRYSDREVGLILRRAAELQSTRAPHGVDAGGLTMAELESIAAEAGIEPGLVRQAAREIDVGSGERRSALLGGPTVLRLEGALDRQIPEPELERLVPRIQETVGAPGDAKVLGRTLTWSSGAVSRGRDLEVRVSSRAQETRIRIEERCDALALQTFWLLIGGVGGLGSVLTFGLGIGPLDSLTVALGGPVAALGGSYLGGRMLFQAATRRRRRALSDLLHRLTEAVQGSPDETGPRHPT